VNFHPCIVTPVYNHEAGAAALTEQLAQYGLPLIMVNDGSDSDCTAVLHKLKAAHDWVEVIDHAENQGKGGAVMTGLNAAYERGFSHALQIDADGQHNSDDIPRFLEASEQDLNAIVIGRPKYDQSIPMARLIGRYATHVWVWIETLSFTIKDSMCGFRVYPLARVSQMLSSVHLGKRMDFDPEILVRLYWEDVPIVSLTTRVIYPPGTKSHFRMWEDNWLISLMHTRLVFGMLWRAPRLLWRKFR
jgi:glycosyltransferase involved in cell wall biosynthesis